MFSLLKRIKNNRIAQNATWIIACKLAQAFLALIVSMITARYLGPANYGIINYAASITAFVVPIMNLGFSNTLVSEFTNNPIDEGRILGTSILLSTFSAILCILGVCLYTLIVDKNEIVTNLTVVLYSLMLIVQAFELLQYWFQAKLISKYVSVISLIAYVVVTIYKIILLIIQANVYWFAISFSIDYLIIAVFLLIAYKKLGGHRLSFSIAVGKRMFRVSKHYIISSLMVAIFGQTDRIMIKLMINESAVGYYSAAYACAGMTSFVFLGIIDSFRPVIFQNKKNKNEIEFEKSIEQLYCIVFYLALAQCIFMCVLSPFIIRLMYGKDYLPSILALQIVVWYTTFAYIGAIRNIWILAVGLQKYLWLLNLSGALLNILLNYFLIRSNGIYGAALASCITQFFTNIIMNHIVWPLRYNNTLIIRGIHPRGIRRLFKL